MPDKIMERLLVQYRAALENARQLLATTKDRLEREKFQSAVGRWEKVVDSTEANIERIRGGKAD